MTYRIQIKRDTDANWTSVNPVLAEGELGFNLTNGGVKCGDGVKAWADLDYFTGFSGNDPYAFHDNIAGEINALSEKSTPVSADELIIEDSEDSNNKKKIQIGNIELDKSQVGLDNVSNVLDKLDATVAPTSDDDVDLGYSAGSIWVDLSNDKAYICLDATAGAAVWLEVTQQASGEANTASNTGSAGIGVFKQKTGVDLEFYKLNAGSNKVSIALDGTDKIDINIVESNIDLNNCDNTTSGFVKSSEAGTTFLAPDGDGSQLTGITVSETDPIVGAINGIVKSDGAGNISAATAGTDYQTPLVAGTDYQTPLVAGIDYQTPLVAGTDYLAPDGDGSGLSGVVTSETDPIVGAITGIVKSDGAGNISAAIAGTDYQTPLVAGTDYQTPLVAGTDYQTPLVAGTDYLAPDGDGSGLSGIVTSESDPVVGAINGIVKADGAGNISAASAGTDYQEPLVAGTDYLAPDGDGSGLSGVVTSESDPIVGAVTGIVKSDGAGNISAASAGTDYQTPLVAGTDYQTPLVAGTDYQTPLVAGTDYLAPDGDGSSLTNMTSSQVGLGNVANLKVKLDATTDPTADDDSGDGYAVGSRWINITDGKEFVCLDATSTAAVWTETTQSGGGGGGWAWADDDGTTPTVAPSATGTDSLAIGDGAVASGTDSVAIGTTATASADDSIAIGDATATGLYSIAIGNDASSTKGSVAIGRNASATDDDESVAIGKNASCDDRGSVSIGASSQGTYEHVAIGKNANASGGNSVSIGSGSSSGGNRGVAIGLAANCLGAYGVALGYSTKNYAADGFACIEEAEVSSSCSGSVAIGYRAKSNVAHMFTYSNRMNADQDFQFSKYLQWRNTTDATQTELTANGGSPATTTRIIIPSGGFLTFEAKIQGTDGTDIISKIIQGTIQNIGGTTALVGSLTTTHSVASAGATSGSWDITMDADDTNDCLRVLVTGEADKNIHWTAVIDANSMKYV